MNYEIRLTDIWDEESFLLKKQGIEYKMSVREGKSFSIPFLNSEVNTRKKYINDYITCQFIVGESLWKNWGQLL